MKKTALYESAFFSLSFLLIFSEIAVGGEEKGTLPAWDSPYIGSAPSFDKAFEQIKPLEDQPAKVEEVEVGPFLETVIGVKTVLIRGKQGDVRVVLEGRQLEFGDSFLTGPKGFIRIAFEQGAQVLIPPESHVTIRQEK